MSQTTVGYVLNTQCIFKLRFEKFFFFFFYSTPGRHCNICQSLGQIFLKPLVKSPICR